MERDVAMRAVELFDSGLYCAESVLLALSETMPGQHEAIPRIATGLCSGMARSGGMCGAVSGAILGIGLAVGRDSAQEPVDPAYTRVRALLESFQEQHGSVVCPELVECDLNTPEGQQVFRQERRIERCRGYVGDAARIAYALVSSSRSQG